MTNVVISGCCGKMGRVVYDIISQRQDINVIAGVDTAGEKYADFEVYPSPAALPCKPDVIIDFSHPSALDWLLEYAKTNGTALVLATTG